MTYDSPLRAIQESTLAFLPTIEGITSAVAAVPWRLFKLPPPGVEQVEINPDTLPPEYPGAVFSLWEDYITIVGEPHQEYGAANITYEVPVSIVIYATSDGADINAARFAALKIGQAAHISLALFTPTGFPANSGSAGPFIPGHWWAIPIDPSTGAVMLDFKCRYQVAVSLPI